MPEGQQRRAHMRPRSAKTEARYKERRALVARLLKARPWCEACELLDRPGVDVVMRSTDIHEKLPRSAGGDILDESNCLAVCRGCHMYLHAHPLLARQLGLLASRYGGA